MGSLTRARVRVRLPLLLRQQPCPSPCLQGRAQPAHYPKITVACLAAVACGQFIFIYKRLRPHYKFTLPAPTLHEEEAAIWKGIWDESLPLDDAYQRLANLVENGIVLTHQSQVAFDILP